MSSLFFAVAADRSGVQPGDRARRSVWHPSRLVVEETVLCGLIVAAGIVSLYACLPRAKVSASMARSVQRLKNPFVATYDEPAVALVPASRPMIAAIHRATRLEQSGRFDQVTRDAWKEAAAEVRRFSFLPVSTGPGTYVRLFMQESEERRVAALAGMLEELLPGRFAALESRRQAAIEADAEQASLLPEVTWFDVASGAPDAVRDMAYDLAELHEHAGHNVAIIAAYREIVGFDHWRTVCDAGASESGFLARAALWRAEFEASQARFALAKAAFEQGFRAWAEACGIVPALGTDDRVAKEMAEHDVRYREVLASLRPDPVDEAITLEL